MKEKLSHLGNLISVIYEDGKLDKKEITLLYDIADRLDIEEHEIIKMLNQPDDYEFVCPDTKEEKIEQLNDLVAMMLADGVIHPNEMVILKRFTDKLELSENDLNQMIEKNRK